MSPTALEEAELGAQTVGLELMKFGSGSLMYSLPTAAHGTWCMVIDLLVTFKPLLLLRCVICDINGEHRLNCPSLACAGGMAAGWMQLSYKQLVL